RRDWHTLCRSWLLHLIHQLFDRMLRFQGAVASNPRLWTSELRETDFSVPHSISAVAFSVNDDLYNLQLFSVVSANLGIPSKLVTKPSNAPCLRPPAEESTRLRDWRDLRRDVVERGVRLLAGDGDGLLIR